MRKTERKRKERLGDSETERQNKGKKIQKAESFLEMRKAECIGKGGQVHQGQAKPLCPSHLKGKQSALGADLQSRSRHLSYTASSRRSREDTAEVPRLFR